QEDGILTIDEKSKEISFAHQTFAEYLAAVWLFTNISNEVGDNKDMVKIVYEICTGLKGSLDLVYPFLLKVLDSLLSRQYFHGRDFPKNLYSYVIDGRVTEAGNIIKVYSGNLNTDISKRSILHLIVIYQKLYPDLDNIFLEVVEKTSKIHSDEFGYNPIDYAFICERYDWVDKMCEKWPNAKFNICLDGLCRLLVFDKLQSYTYLVKTALPYFVYQDIMLKAVGKHETLQSYQSYLKKFTVNVMSFEDINMPLSQLPLLKAYTEGNLCHEVVFGNTNTVKAKQR
ncbi:hypothetical protein ILUMI_18363, partial [Ignelater luminosus]